ncbi:MAG TPA: hypothetical protein VGP72_13755 [Planctomycetota bacterium]|jgi:hypothetical protein
MYRSASKVVLLLCLVAASVLAADTPDLTAQLSQMQEQMRTMSQKVEQQQKKIDDQDKVIAQLKGSRLPIGRSPAADSLQRPESTPERPARALDEGPAAEARRSWELPTVTVESEREAGALKEEDRVGSYGQPRWTARRRFAETRVYVIPKGEFEFEYWNIIEKPRHGSAEVETKYEAEIGLGHRLQLDLYAISHAPDSKTFAFDEQDVELRYAFADWGKIPANPTVYAEYKFLDKEADHCEFKMLFGDETSIKGLHWAANTVFEHAMGGSQTNSYEVTGGVSYTVTDQKFSVGGEVKVAFEDEVHHRGVHQPEVLIGPSFQLSPVKQMHIDIAPLFGCSDKSPVFKSLLIVGWEF